MEEEEYKSVYNELATIRCVFEKALTNNLAQCRLAKHFCLADREGYSCKDSTSSSRCNKFLAKVREKSAFVLKLRKIDGPLAHNMDIRVQVGGLTGVVKLMASNIENSDSAIAVDDINGTLDQVVEKYGSLERLPYGEVIQSVEQFQGRRRRQR